MGWHLSCVVVCCGIVICWCVAVIVGAGVVDDGLAQCALVMG